MRVFDWVMVVRVTHLLNHQNIQVFCRKDRARRPGGKPPASLPVISVPRPVVCSHPAGPSIAQVDGGGPEGPGPGLPNDCTHSDPTQPRPVRRGERLSGWVWPPCPRGRISRHLRASPSHARIHAGEDPGPGQPEAQAAFGVQPCQQLPSRPLTDRPFKFRKCPSCPSRRCSHGLGRPGSA